MIVRIAIRGFAKGRIIFRDFATIGDDDLENLLPSLAAKHAERMAAHELHVIEVEFLDEPNKNERFFRFGTDPSGMVLPLGLLLDASDRIDTRSTEVKP